MVAAVLAANGGLIPPAERLVPAGDKLAHFVLIGGLALVANLAWRTGWLRVGPLRLMAGSVVVGLLMSAEEVTQLWITNRTFSLADLTANWLGALAASLVAARLIRRGRALRREMVLARRSIAANDG